ncbi:cytochrome c-type biogenesis protein CcmH [Mesorhizobium sp. M1C.F.Ca.ET.193.01.1.1]|uniref:cytochrome c-type biogenesis protein n=1 Tax=unclassified Mesorhizobium TaxID=325217 RepID=UPI000FD38659|nr:MULTISPECIES: cytochrome c-type biogenesis protein [unclassified Mesorhizobium]TGS96474.1 cytochrome c-type biogenesis protein CcmH [bacterium M00.F.Ca.ET.177.01.1.1]TGQ52204.1 cytochrome c-type biogenesis protein CcmH [Mesorhizobium sp. M1C.F.Ca.ET.210.01.1.1]TGQ68843.1 cytochrome c-type biogenesis protein CcmH [Mesorhizobium sp. M1C.F.Ca.ET.212.01.1.1]TGR04194.1 cytochrome c-type biogenesis protein CcmH [Mesorhizobium sp. M1C.F.Ca.ET.204.01.1.1]TGR24859.1 cytochrome c-type biogenesis prot
MKAKFSLASLVLLLALVFAGAAQAVKPDEVLPDPALEARARALSEGLRCMVCQNQSIDESDADLARDLRILVRQRLVAGDTDQQVMDYIVSRYGEFVLLKPRFSLRNALLWGTPVLLLLAGGIFIVLSARSRRSASVVLSAEEQAALDKMLSRD